MFGIVMIVDKYLEELECSCVLGVVLVFISFGSLVVLFFGGIFYEFVGKCVFFLVLVVVLFFDVLLLLVVVKFFLVVVWVWVNLLVGIFIYCFMLDFYIVVVVGVFIICNIFFVFLEFIIVMWMKYMMVVFEWEMGMVWLLVFVFYVLGVYFIVCLVVCYLYL